MLCAVKGDVPELELAHTCRPSSLFLRIRLATHIALLVVSDLSLELVRFV